MARIRCAVEFCFGCQSETLNCLRPSYGGSGRLRWPGRGFPTNSQEEVMDYKAAVYSAAKRGGSRVTWLYVVVVATLIAGVALPASAAGRFVAHNTPRYVATAKNLGTEDPAKTIEVSIWLNPHNRAALDGLARQFYDRTSPNYRHFLTSEQAAARFAPTAAEAKTVQEFFEGHGLTVVRVGPHNMFVRARGTVGEI